jgi:hypothetical protein
MEQLLIVHNVILVGLDIHKVDLLVSHVIIVHHQQIVHKVQQMLIKLYVVVVLLIIILILLNQYAQHV